MESMSGVAAKTLKALRKRAGISIKGMADAIGMAKSTYQYNEDGYKKPFFEDAFVNQVRGPLVARGISPKEIDALGRGPVINSRTPTRTGLVGNTELKNFLQDSPQLDTDCVLHAAMQVIAAMREHNIEDVPEAVAKSITELAADYTRERQQTSERTLSLGGKTVVLPSLYILPR